MCSVAVASRRATAEPENGRGVGGRTGVIGSGMAASVANAGRIRIGLVGDVEAEEEDRNIGRERQDMHSVRERRRRSVEEERKRAIVDR